MSALSDEKLKQMGITRAQAEMRGLVPKSFQDRQQRIERDMQEAKHLNYISSDPIYLAQRAAAVKKYDEKEAERLEERRKKYDPTFGEEFVRGMERFIDDFDSAMDYIQYVPILGQAAAAANAIGHGIVESSKGNYGEGLEQLGRGVTKAVDAVTGGATSKIYDAGMAATKAIVDLAEGEFDMGKLTDVASNVASIATGSEAGKKVLSGLEAEGKKALSETATRMLDHAKKQGLTQVSDTGRQLLAQVVG